MGRIFHLSYQHALERVSSNPYSHPKEISKNNFSQILADFEKKGSESKALSSIQNIPISSEYITNLDLGQNAKVNTSPSLNVTSEFKGSTNFDNDSGVNELTIPVKITPAMAYNSSTSVKAFSNIKEITNFSDVTITDTKTTIFKEQLEPKLEKNEYIDMISASGRYHGLDPSLALAIAKAESSFNYKAVSSDGFYSKGLFQLLDSTAKDMLKRLGLTTKYKPFDPKQNTHLGVGYLRYLHNIFSTPTELAPKLKTFPANNASELEKIAVAAYNVGEGAVAEAQEKANNSGKNPGQFDSIKRYLPMSTRDYVARVSQNKRVFDGNIS